MQHRDGPSWLINEDVPYHVNFVLWLKRKAANPELYPEHVWHEWLARVVVIRDAAHDQICELAPNAELQASAAEQWPAFITEFNAIRRRLHQQLHQESVKARLQEIMGDSDRRFALFYTYHPGDLCLRFGDTWVLGEAFFDAGRIRELVTRIRDEG